MVQEDPRPVADAEWKLNEIQSQVMDFHRQDVENGVPIVNRCYSSNIRETGLEPTASASYACRWMYKLPVQLLPLPRVLISVGVIARHLTQGPLTFEEFILIVHDLLPNHSKRERDEILSGLRRFQRRYQLKGSYGPSFRPSFVPLRDGEQLDDSFEWSDSAAEHPNLPAFLSIPCIHFETPVGRPPHDTTHHAKTLPQYHYRFGKPNLTNRGPRIDIASILEEEDSPHIRELWCLAIDDKNLLTSSSLTAPTIWPTTDQGSEPSNRLGLSTSAKIALRQYFKGDTKLIDPGTQHIFNLTPFLRTAKITGIPFATLSPVGRILKPIGWIIGPIFRSLDSHLNGVDSVDFARLLSFSDMIAQSRGLNRNKAHEWLQVSMPFERLGAQRHSRSIAPRLCAMVYHVQRWIEIEKTARVQADPSDEIFHTLRKLWSIAVRFTMNFYFSQDHLYEFHHTGFLKGLFNRKRPLRADEVQYRSHGSRKPCGTLKDLELEFVAAVATLKRQQGTKLLNIQASIHRENEDLLRFVHKFETNLSLACLFHMCIISTPTRFSITSRDITDMFATTTSNLEWLIRDSVSQPLVYQISAVAEDLRIMKDVLQSQTQVIFAVASSLARLLANSRSINDAGKGASSTAESSKQTENHDSQQSRETYIFKILQRRPQFRHRHLANDIERLAETAERLKVQAALLINIKAEDKNVAIFIFTVVTVVFLPLSFVTSYLGMNTSDVRDLKQGQWLFWAIGGAVTVITLMVICILAFRGPKWKRARQNYKLSILADSKWE